MAVDLLPRLAWPGTGRADQDLRLAEAADVSHDAAAAALAAGDRSAAARSAEARGGVLWAGLLTHGTTPRRCGRSRPTSPAA